MTGVAAALADRYRIERELGAGGMATVYLAHDLKHDRKVAIKVLKPELAAVLGADRFLVEIKTTAALQHPHILPLFDSGEIDGLLYYVMPYVEGETIRAKLDRETQFGVDEAVHIAREIGDALDYAHRRGVIHRDIKPENILLHDGRAMVMDFGIALAVSAAAGGRMTETGLSLGTPHYMSPEQATAEKDITPRSDVYSLGAVIYEMLTGDPPHTGASAQQVIMKIITEPAEPVTKYRKSVPPNVAAAVAKALEKLPADRFESAKAFGDALSTPGFSYQTPSQSGSSSATGSRKPNRFVIASSVVTVAALAFAAWSLTRSFKTPVPVSLDLDLAAARVSGQDVTISPDGSMLAYSGAIENGRSAIFLRHLNGGAEFAMLPGTEGGSYPTFSPDNAQIAFRRDDGVLLKMSVVGGGTSTIATTINGYQLHWGAPNLIAFTGPLGAWVVPSTGGTPKSLRRLGGRRLFVLPDASGVLGVSGGDVALYDLRTDSVSILVRNGRHPVYVAGYLLFDDDQGGLAAVRFDLRRQRVIGSPERVLDHVAYNAAARGYSVSNTGTLVWHVGAAATGAQSGGASRLVVSDFNGRSDTLQIPASRPNLPRFSPSGSVIAYISPSDNPNRADIFTYDLATKTNTQITFSGNNASPIWSPDGSRILYTGADSAGLGSGRLHIKAADNSGADELLEGVPPGATPTAWPRDDLILYSVSTPTEQGRIMMVAPKRDAKPQLYLATRDPEFEAVLTPDGKYAAYTSNEGGAFNVWMRDFPNPVGKWKLSVAHGGSPRWSKDGKFLYYLQIAPPHDTLWRVQVDRTPSIALRTPVVAAIPGMNLGRDAAQQWDLHPDGKRFIFTIDNAPVRDSSRRPVRYVVILNWFTEVEAALTKARK
jgi:serine/threonine protein kinase/Tol biopolymer transport system component